MADTTATLSEIEDEEISAINIIPFVDIVLVLLIIFMVTSTAIVRASLQVNLPKAASAGGSSVVASCIGCAVLLRISHEFSAHMESTSDLGGRYTHGRE